MFKQNQKNLKTGVFIDGANLFWACKKDKNWPIDFKKLKEYLKKYYSPIIYNYYGCEDKNPSTQDFKKKADGQLKFYNKLEGLGYKIIKKPLKYIKENNKFHTKCDMDVDIAIDMKNSLKDLERIILFTGDSDFLKAVSDCRIFSKSIKIYSFKNTLAWELKLFAIKNTRCSFKYLDDLKSELEFIKN